VTSAKLLRARVVWRFAPRCAALTATQAAINAIVYNRILFVCRLIRSGLVEERLLSAGTPPLIGTIRNSTVAKTIPAVEGRYSMIQGLMHMRGRYFNDYVDSFYPATHLGRNTQFCSDCGKDDALSLCNIEIHSFRSLSPMEPRPGVAASFRHGRTGTGIERPLVSSPHRANATGRRRGM
jgi:hypothetical protein